jgi:hypothetical protein
VASGAGNNRTKKERNMRAAIATAVLIMVGATMYGQGKNGGGITPTFQGHPITKIECLDDNGPELLMCNIMDDGTLLVRVRQKNFGK